MLSLKHQNLLQKLTQLGVLEQNLEIKFIKGQGPGGQKINKTTSCVWIKHPYSGIIVKCQEGRSQSQNYLRALEILAEKLETKLTNEKLKIQQEKEKSKRRNRKRSKQQKESILKTKKHRSITKSYRKKIVEQD